MHNLNSMYNRLNQMFSSTAYRLRNLLSEESCMLHIECSYTAGCLQCITLYSIVNIILLGHTLNAREPRLEAGRIMIYY